MLSHSKNGDATAPQCYVYTTLPALLRINIAENIRSNEKILVTLSF
jgi:hypothetical protein